MINPQPAQAADGASASDTMGQDALAALLCDLETIERESGSVISLAARNLQTGEMVGYHADRKVSTASVIKLPILVHVALAVREGRLSWGETLTLLEAEKVGGSGILTSLTAGLALPLRDACTLMIILSDNTGTNMVIDHVGIEPVNARMRALGLPRTTLFRKAYSQSAVVSRAEARFGLGVTTPHEMVRLLTLLAEGKVGDAETSADILKILEGQHYRESIPRLLPAEWKYAGKTGALNHVRNDVGLVTLPDGRRFALALFCQNIPGVLWTADNPGHLALARIARRVLAYWTGGGK
ncbi:MAG TPA: serine hydrolase [Chthonomonadaceae bacterium]|nr:serine hydrolase [Chthonomonadaceae bacterium]